MRISIQEDKLRRITVEGLTPSFGQIFRKAKSDITYYKHFNDISFS
jgi:hypothetical protein